MDELLRCRPARTVERGGEIVDRRLYAALLVRDAGERERHLGDAERADLHALVDVAEMADAEVLSGIGTEARAVGDVEGLEREIAELVGVMAARQHHRGDGRRVVFRVLAHDLEAPGLDRAPRRLRQPLMAGGHAGTSFLP